MDADFEITDEDFDDIKEVKVGLSREEVPDNTIFANYSEDNLMVVSSLHGCEYGGSNSAQLLYDIFEYAKDNCEGMLSTFKIKVEIEDR